MEHSSRFIAKLPPEQQAIRDKCFHPTGKFIEFTREDIEQSIPERFEQQVRKYPDCVAVKTREEQFTYDELNRAANRVAHALLAQLGEGPEAVVLLFEQGAQFIVAMLSIAKAGKFYILVDPSLPQNRIDYFLKDSQARLIVTNKRNLAIARKSAGPRIQLLDVDEIDNAWPAEDTVLPISLDSAAYLAYTSGSTGQPKGVVQTHRNLLYHTMTGTNDFHICAEDRWSLLAFGTNQMIKIVLRALLNGAGLYPLGVKEEGVAPIADWLIQQEITLYYSSASLFRHFVDTLAGDEEFPHLRLIRLASQTVTHADVDLYKKHFSSNCVMVNGLASTESFGDSVNYFIDKSTRISTRTVPVGYPVEGTEILMIDDEGQRVGVNQIGEIAIKNRYLSPGYWQSPDLTQAKFLPDPNGGDERIYYTGDLGRMLPDGCLEHLGRKDFRVKIRGYSVDVYEVESVLMGLPQVKEVVVMGRADSTGGQRLVAYLVPSSQTTPSISEMRKSLGEKLPDYMIPSAFLSLDALPLLPSGKVNRRDLPEPGTARPNLETVFVEPRTPVEEALTEIWAKVLGLDQVGIHDNFFELGGDSLLASQVISRVIKSLQVEVPLRTLFEAPTVADMAVAIIQNQAEKAEEEDLDQILAELEALPHGEAQRLLSDENQSTTVSDN